MACVDLYEFKGQVVLEAAVIGDCEVAVFRPTTFGTGGRLNRRGSGGGSGRTGSGSGGRGELTVSEDGVRWLPVYKSGRGMAARNTPHQVSVTTKGIVASNEGLKVIKEAQEIHADVDGGVEEPYEGEPLVVEDMKDIVATPMTEIDEIVFTEAQVRARSSR